MQDRPNYDELLEAVERFLDEEVVAKNKGSLRFNGRVSANVIRILRRELLYEEKHTTSEWNSLDQLLGVQAPPPGRESTKKAITERTAELCKRIKNGEADEGTFRKAVLAHLRQTLQDKLSVTHPGWAGPPPAGQGKAGPDLGPASRGPRS